MDSENFKEQVSAVFKALFPANSISFDEEERQFVGFIDHQFIYGVYGPKSINLRVPDNDVEKLEKNIKQRLDNCTLEPMPDIRPVYSSFWDRGVQITFGKLPREWQPRN